MTPSRWSLDSAQAMFAEVRARTADAVAEVEALVDQREVLAADAPERRALDEQIRDRIGRWARAMEALGVDVKGVWLVDFRAEGGCYCWRWPEPELAWFHGADEGFAERVRIQ